MNGACECAGRAGRPIFVANARVKPPTGRGPFDVSYDSSGVARDLATGSGFWAAEAGVSTAANPSSRNWI